MDFTLTEDQQLLQDSISRVISDNYPFDVRERDASSAKGYGVEFWQQGADLGWNAIPFAESDGGFGGGLEEIAIVMEAFGHGLVVSPYWCSVIFAGGVLRRASGVTDKIATLVDGSAIATVAFAEPHGRYNLAYVETLATRANNGWILKGEKIAVPYAASAQWIIVPARLSGDAADANGVALFAVATDVDGLHIHDYATVDGHRAANLRLDSVHVSDADCIVPSDQGSAVLSNAASEATLALGAEALGAVEFTVDATLEYTRNRKQFGQPISSFQALQHRMVDMFMSKVQLRSLVYRSIISLANGAPNAQEDLAALKYYVGGPVRTLGQEAVQLHGGMGMTWEMAVAHYFKRLTVLDVLLGNADHHLTRFAQLTHPTSHE